MQLFFTRGEKTDARTWKGLYNVAGVHSGHTHTHTHNRFFFPPNQRTMYYLCFHLGLV